jgi:hypothetical protein
MSTDDDKQIRKSLDKMRTLFKDVQTTMLREQAKTKKLVEALMQIADLPGKSKHGDIARTAVEAWLK